jgi:RNA polymerase sigma factor (TIGR02999 family)
MDDDVTQLLVQYQSGDSKAEDRLWDAVYDELRTLARHRMRGERKDHTLGTTALVHECYLKLVDQTQVEWDSRLHFYAMASRIMRNILVDYARRRTAQKRGGGAPHVDLEKVQLSDSQETANLFIALDTALSELASMDERMAKVVEYRFFGGMTEKEIAELLDVSARTVRRDWRKAKGWLARALDEDT